MAVSPARAAAYDILLRVSTADAYAVELLHSERLRELSTADKGLATELVMGVLRWQSRLDGTVSAASSQPLRKLDSEVLIALRLAAYQLQFLTRVPARAAVNESVELVKRARKRSAVPFANAVLRKLIALTDAGTEPACESRALGAEPSVEELAASCAHPEWLVSRWMEQFGAGTAARICAHGQRIPPTVIRLGDAAAEAEVRDAGIDLAPGALLSSARLVGSGDVTTTEPFRSGRVAIQDEASQLVALLVGMGRRLLDCCAAPGSKTSALAARNPEAHIVAADLHPHRVRIMQQLVRAPNVEFAATAIEDLPRGEAFDRVLADVPCSGTGTLARNPEIKWKLRPEDLADLQARQVRILQAAMAQVAPGGRLVYSTCSLEKEENQDVVAAALAGSAGFRLLDCAAELEPLRASGDLTWEDPASLCRGGFLRTLPGTHPCDGFFAAILQRD